MNKTTVGGLPQHNKVLQGVYIFIVIGMLTFMTIVIGGYWMGEHRQKALPQLVERPSLNILGKKFVLNLSKSIEEQLTAHWLTVYNDPELFLSNVIQTDKIIYQIYSNYDGSDNTVDVLLGFKVNTVLEGDYQQVHLSEGKMLPKDSVLDSWYRYESLPVVLSFELDYEVLELDDGYEILSQKAFLNVNRGDF